MQQVSNINVEMYESAFRWEIHDLDRFEWKEETFLLSDEIRFDKIDVRWWVKKYLQLFKS